MSAAMTAYALERGRAPALLPHRTRCRSIAYYDVVILPSAPLSIGQRVKIYTLAPIARPGCEGIEDGEQKWYKARPADVEGEIIGIRTMELAVTEFILKNEVNQSLVEHAYLTVQHIQGETVLLDAWRRIARTLALPILSHTRHVPVERTAIVVGDDE